MYYLTLDDIKFVFSELDHFFKLHKDPVPHFSSSYHEKIESIIACPQKTFSRKDLYPDIFSKAACYLYFTNTLHPFMNGNKRMSIMMTYVFLRKNGYLFEADEDEIYDFAKEIADGHKNQDEEYKKVVDFIKTHTRRIPLIESLELDNILKRFRFWIKK